MKDSEIQQDISDKDLDRLERGGIVAIDTETTGLNLHRDTLCLVQISDRSGNVIFLQRDDWKKASNLKKLLKNKSIKKVFHVAIFDCSVLFLHTGIMPQNIFCTKTASKLARTYTQNHSMKDLVWEFFSINIDKSTGSSFWKTGNLTHAQLEYAANDVVYLIKIKEKLEAIMETKNKIPTGISYLELNKKVQEFFPTLVHLYINGWDIGSRDKSANPLFTH